jgi:hypothetical protein
VIAEQEKKRPAGKDRPLVPEIPQGATTADWLAKQDAPSMTAIAI